MSRMTVLGVWLGLCVSLPAADEFSAQLPTTAPLTWDDDLADRMMDGLHRFVERKIEHAVANRQQFWKRDTSSPEAYEKSIAPNRDRRGRPKDLAAPLLGSAKATRNDCLCVLVCSALPMNDSHEYPSPEPATPQPRVAVDYSRRIRSAALLNDECE